MLFSRCFYSQWAFDPVDNIVVIKCEVVHPFIRMECLWSTKSWVTPHLLGKCLSEITWTSGDECLDNINEPVILSSPYCVRRLQDTQIDTTTTGSDDTTLISLLLPFPVWWFVFCHMVLHSYCCAQFEECFYFTNNWRTSILKRKGIPFSLNVLHPFAMQSRDAGHRKMWDSDWSLRYFRWT